MDELINAIKVADIEKLSQLLTTQSALANQDIPQQGISPLMLAVYYRNPAIINIIRSFKKEINFYEASALGEIEIVKQWIESQPDLLNAFSPDGFTALGFACFFGHYSIAKMLIEKGADVNIASNNSFKVAPIHSACAISKQEIIGLLLENGADANAKQQNGVTPLHEVAHHGQTQLAQLLIDYGADVNAKTDTGQTPLFMAEEKGFIETANLIRQYGGK
jgi:uncharacterized protein